MASPGSLPMLRSFHKLFSREGGLDSTSLCLLAPSRPTSRLALPYLALPCLLCMLACLPAVGPPLSCKISPVCGIVAPLVRRRKMKLATLVLAHEEKKQDRCGLQAPPLFH